MITHNINKNLLILILISFFSFISIFLSYKLPIMWDWGLHATIVEDIISKQEISNLWNYPIFFHTTNSIFWIIIWNSVYKIINTLITSFLLWLILFLFAREITKNYLLSLTFWILWLIHPYVIVFTTAFFMDPFLMLFIFLTQYVLFKYTNTLNIKYFGLLILFSWICVSIKQFWYVIPIIVSIQFFILLFKKVEFVYILKKILFLNLGALIISIWFLYHMFSIHWTIIDPANPLVSKWMNEINQNAFNYIYKTDIFQYSHLNSRTTFNDIINFYNIRDYYAKSSLDKWIFIILILSWVIFLLKNNYRLLLALLIFILPYHLVLSQVKTEKYFLHLKVFVLILLIFWIYAINKKIRNIFLSMLFISVFIALSLIEGQKWIKHVVSREYNFCWLWSKYRYTDIIRVFDYINNNSKKEEIVLSPCAYEWEYYSKRKFLWLSPYENSDFFIELNKVNSSETVDNNILHDFLRNENIKYIVIYDNIVGKEKNTTQNLTLNELEYLKRLDFLKEIDWFNWVTLFKYEKNSND